MVLSFEVTPVFAEYYIPRELPGVSRSDLEYKSVSLNKMTGDVEKLKTLIRSNGKKKQILALLYRCFETYYSTHNAYSIASLASDRFYNEQSVQDLNESVKINVEAYNKMNEAIELVYNSDYKPLLSELLGEGMVDLYIDNIPTQKVVELTNKELELVNRYAEIFGDSSACAELFVELVSVRNEIAKECGYDNYADYANEIVYG